MARKAADQVATIGIDVVCKNSSNCCLGVTRERMAGRCNPTCAIRFNCFSPGRTSWSGTPKFSVRSKRSSARTFCAE